MDEVRRAVNLNAMILQVSRMLGPAFSGTLVAWLGAAPAFWLNGLSFAAVIGSLLLVRTQQVCSQRGAGAAGGMGAALGFIRSQPRIQDLLVFVMLLTFFGLAVLTIVPAVAHGVPQVTGWLLAASGFGALLSTIVLVPLSQAARYTGRVVAGAVLWMGTWFTVLPLPAVRLTCWVGAGERSEFIRQNALLANAWTGLGAQTACVQEPDRHHFNVIDGLREARSALTTALVGEA